MTTTVAICAMVYGLVRYQEVSERLPKRIQAASRTDKMIKPHSVIARMMIFIGTYLPNIRTMDPDSLVSAFSRVSLISPTYPDAC